MNKYIKNKIKIGFFSFFVLVIPLFAFGQQPPRAIPVNETTLQPIQINTRDSGQSSSVAGSVALAQGASSVRNCMASTGLVGLVQNKISSNVGGMVGTRVPTGNAVIEGKETGILGVVSWDQMGWCLVNGLIESITASTVEWINNGFEGNPVFVTDPAGFFANLADVQAGQFINELSGGFLCQPIQNIVRVNLAQSYNRQISPYGQQAQCTFSGTTANLEQFMSGETFSWDNWLSYTQNPQNNPLGATMLGQIEMDRRIAGALGLESTKLDWGAGFFSIKDKETGKIVSPGTVIETQINERLFSGQRRLEVADEFNEVVSALVNQLIKRAVGEMTQSSGSS